MQFEVALKHWKPNASTRALMKRIKSTKSELDVEGITPLKIDIEIRLQLNRMDGDLGIPFVKLESTRSRGIPTTHVPHIEAHSPPESERGEFPDHPREQEFLINGFVVTLDQRLSRNSPVLLVLHQLTVAGEAFLNSLADVSDGQEMRARFSYLGTTPRPGFEEPIVFHLFSELGAAAGHRRFGFVPGKRRPKIPEWKPNL